MDISFVWWNTSLSPTYRLRNKAVSAKSSEAAAVVKMIGDVYHPDIIALCEVSPDDIDRIISSGSLAGYDHRRAMDPAGRSAFDMCVFYQPHNVSIVSAVAVLSIKGKRVTKIGQHITLGVVGVARPFHVFLSHWPSRLNVQQYEPTRHVLGLRLRDAIDTVFEGDARAHILLMGDYNDEPFDASIAEHLMATRDKELVLRREHLFYNPFWRHMVCFSNTPNSAFLSDKGSYFHRAGELTQWRTFDQMMFSQSLIDESEWSLDESNTRILEVPGLLALSFGGNSRFDHLPLIGRLKGA